MIIQLTDQSSGELLEDSPIGRHGDQKSEALKEAVAVVVVLVYMGVTIAIGIYAIKNIPIIYEDVKNFLENIW